MIFKFFIGGYFGGHYELAAKKGLLICFVSEYPVKPLEPTDTFNVRDDHDWQILLQYLRTIKWKSNYDAGICDGTQWTLEFKAADIKIKSYGSNVYPKGFKKLIKLLNNVTMKHGISASL